MDDSIVKEVVETATKEHERDYFADFGGKGYSPIRIVDENFSEISAREHTGKIVFIDGGNAEVASGPNFSFHFFRIYYCIYEGKERKLNGRNEFFALVSTKEGGDGIVYTTKFFKGAPIGDLEFFPNDETLKDGLKRAKISRVGDVIRRFSELQTAINVMEILEEDDVIVLDGNLEAAFTGEQAYFDRLYRKAGERNVAVVGFSKTTSLLTKKGTPLAKIFLSKRPNGLWHYSPVVEIMNESHKADIFFAKLHPDSNFVFRVDIYDGVPYNTDNLFGALCSHSKDPVFLGYPYGLIEADKFARVSNQEKEMLQTEFRVKCGIEWEKIEKISKSQSAHDVLDRVG